MANRVEFAELGNRHAVGKRNGQRPDYLRQIDSQPTVLGAVETAFVQRQLLTCTDYDNSVRWNVGERLHNLFEARCDRFGDRAALLTANGPLTYRQLDERANQLARHLIAEGVQPGDRVALLFDKSVETYVALLAVLKAKAAYVPLDPGFPVERLHFILADANIKTAVSMNAFAERLQPLDIRKVFVDGAAHAIAAQPRHALGTGEVGQTDDQLCYIIYTSGTTGNPKGVAIEHRSICNFVQVASELYGYRPGDRVYQGMAICFDFSVEEIWVPWMAGATVVPGKPGGSLVGDELADFLRERDITCMACCPTLLATIEQELPSLRVLLVGGEACPHPLVKRWHRPGRTILNSYGPTEATVTATLTELTPHEAVTIGKPLPTYSIVILDPANDQLAAPGETGEIGIAGIGLAAFYVNREELTHKKFIPDFLGIANNPSARIYRTGDLGRITEAGEIEYLGRIDTQVKIRGYRIELTEIESVLLALPQVAQAAVTTYEPEPGTVELVGYYALKPGAASLSRNEIAQALRAKLPAYMVPAFIEQLPFIPMSISNKADHKRLPKPKGPRCGAGSGREIVPARTENERFLADAIAEVMQLDQVSTEDHFFEHLAANSLLMARVCAKLRQVSATAHVSMRDIYMNPTVAQLAAFLERGAQNNATVEAEAPFHTPSDFAYYGCGTLQLAFYAVYALLGLAAVAAGFHWTYAAVDSTLDLYLRATAFAAMFFFGFSALPIAAKWLLIGEWKAESFPIWSLRYFRFWMVKTLIRTAPAAAFVGSPIYNVYLRLLGARIGRNAVIKSRFVPVTTDLFSVGDNTVLRKDSILLGYKAQSNFIHIGPVEIGSNAFVGEASVLDIDTKMGNDTQLGHASSLQSGQCVPDGKRYHGSPAVETESNYCPIENRADGALRSGLYAAGQLIALIAIATPLPIALLNYWYPVVAPFVAGAETASATTAGFLGVMLLASAGLFVGSLLVGLFGIYVAPRLANLFLTPGRDYPLYGLHYWMQQLVFRLSNSQFYNVLFGDSSFIVSHMRLLGWKLNDVDQTGSNFGTNQRHDNPFLCDIGSGTMVSDGLSMINMQMSSSTFRLETARIGDRNYLGNDIHYPPGGRTGANVLLATKVMIPVDGPVRENVGLLGSPCFEIPRIVDRDKDVNAAIVGEVRRERLRAKNWHNLITAGLFLAARFAFFFAALVVSHLAVLNYDRYGVLALFAASAVLSVGSVLFFTLLERASLGFKRLVPTMKSIYDPYFWSHERHWKLSDSPITELFGGTPFKNVVSRLMGVEVGRKVFDGGCSITERTLTQIGDYANINEGSVMQAHSLEEGVFKSDYIQMGAGCTIGAGAFVHYGVTMGDHVVLEADSFLMKGEVLECHSVWRGNPATMVRSRATQNVVGIRTLAEEPVMHEEPELLAAACVAAE